MGGITTHASCVAVGRPLIRQTAAGKRATIATVNPAPRSAASPDVGSPLAQEIFSVVPKSTTTLTPLPRGHAVAFSLAAAPSPTVCRALAAGAAPTAAIEVMLAAVTLLVLAACSGGNKRRC